MFCSRAITVCAWQIIQFGICLFHENKEGDGYLARPCTLAASAAARSLVLDPQLPLGFPADNVYLFPAENIGSPLLHMECEAVHFNRKCHMDFNRWIREGVGSRAHAVLRLGLIAFCCCKVSYCDEMQESRLQAKIWPQPDASREEKVGAEHAGSFT